jgi:hypothetical protein
MKFLSLITFTLFSFSLSAAEADNFTAKTLDILDIRSEVNELANSYLNKAATDANALGACDEKVLYVELQKYFSNHSKGELVKTILYGQTISKYALPLKESVYGEWDVFDGYLLGRKKATSSPLALSPLIKIGEQIIGVDKLEHMFGMGFSYFSELNKGKDIEKILKKGILYEKTALGGNVLATGVFSYADLAANFNGMRFWNHMLLKSDDILGSEHNLGPYLSCNNDKWEVVNTIDFKNYIDQSMDESVNCSKFAARSGKRKFIKAITARNFNVETICRTDNEDFQNLANKYKARNIQHFILNDDGPGIVSYFNEF